MNNLRYFYDNQNQQIKEQEDYINFINNQNQLSPNDIVLLTAFYNDILGNEDIALKYYKDVNPKLILDEEILFDFYLCFGSTYNWNFKFNDAIKQLQRAKEIDNENKRVDLFILISKYGLKQVSEQEVLDISKQINARSVEFAKEIIDEINKNCK